MVIRYMSKIILLFAMLLLLTACGDNQPEEDAERMMALGEEFVEEIKDLLGDRESEIRLRSQEAVLSTQDATYNIHYLDQFNQAYQASHSAEVTMIFQTGSFVVSKVIFEDGQGYYFRYEYNTFEPDNIAVSSQFLDEVEIVEDSGLAKIEMTLLKEKKNPIVITFRNIVRNE